MISISRTMSDDNVRVKITIKNVLDVKYSKEKYLKNKYLKNQHKVYIEVIIKLNRNSILLIVFYRYKHDINTIIYVHLGILNKCVSIVRLRCHFNIYDSYYLYDNTKICYYILNAY